MVRLRLRLELQLLWTVCSVAWGFSPQPSALSPHLPTTPRAQPAQRAQPSGAQRVLGPASLGPAQALSTRMLNFPASPQSPVSTQPLSTRPPLLSTRPQLLNTRPQLLSTRGRGTKLNSGGWAVPDEDDWVGSDSWESFRKSNARRRDKAAQEEDAREKARDQQQQQARREAEVDQDDGLETGTGGAGKRRGWGEKVEWMRVAGCDVCLPKDKRKPLQGSRFTGIIHFIGGVFVGVVPKQAYRVLIEGIVAKTRVVVVATPCSGLAGMDHYKAAYEAAFKFQGACIELQAELGKEVFDVQDYPIIGLGHSLGCKVQLLVNSVPDARGAIPRARAANIFLAFNNFGAKESIPVLSQLNKVQQEVTKGIASAAPVFDRISAFANSLKENPEFKDVLGTPEATKGLEFLSKLTDVGKKAAANVQSEVAEEFSPAPDDTFKLLEMEYDVGRNLVVKFLDDTIDQSIDLCVELRNKFTDPEKGIGGRLDLKRLAGTHVTPNTPDLENLENSPISEGLGNLEEFANKNAQEIMEQVDALADTVSEFIKEEAQRDQVMPRSSTRLTGAETE